MAFTLTTWERWNVGQTRCDLHKAGCADLKRNESRPGFAYNDPCDGVEDAVESGLASDASDITVMPCAKTPKRQSAFPCYSCGSLYAFYSPYWDRWVWQSH